MNFLEGHDLFKFQLDAGSEQQVRNALDEFFTQCQLEVDTAAVMGTLALVKDMIELKPEGYDCVKGIGIHSSIEEYNDCKFCHIPRIDNGKSSTQEDQLQSL